MGTKEHEGVRGIEALDSELRRSAHSISREIIGTALKVHSTLGPGLFESAYEACLAHELRKRGFRVLRQVILPLVYDGVQLDEGYRIDLLVDDLVIVELKTVEAIHPVHEAQIISYLKLSKKPLGLILNFKVSHMRDGIKRFVNGPGWDELRGIQPPRAQRSTKEDERQDA
jgi:GxxExxY protein